MRRIIGRCGRATQVGVVQRGAGQQKCDLVLVRGKGGGRAGGSPTQKKMAESFRSRPFLTNQLLRRETPERAADISFAQSFQSAISQLPDTLACDAEHGADFLECVLTSTFE